MMCIPVPVRNLEFTEADSMLRDSGYPHDEGSFPHSQEVISRTFEGLSDEDREKSCSATPRASTTTSTSGTRGERVGGHGPWKT